MINFVTNQPLIDKNDFYHFISFAHYLFVDNKNNLERMRGYLSL